MDKELLRLQKKWDFGISFAIIDQSNIPGKSLSHISAFLCMSSPLVLRGFAFNPQSKCFSWTLFYKHNRECLSFCLERASDVQSLISEFSKILDSPPTMVLLPHRGPSWTPTFLSAPLQAPVLTEDCLSTGQNLVQTRPTFLLFWLWHFVYLASFPIASVLLYSATIIQGNMSFIYSTLPNSAHQMCLTYTIILQNLQKKKRVVLFLGIWFWS